MWKTYFHANQHFCSATNSLHRQILAKDSIKIVKEPCRVGGEKEEEEKEREETKEKEKKKKKKVINST